MSFSRLNIILGTKTAINKKIIESKKFHIILGNPASGTIKNSIKILEDQPSYWLYKKLKIF